LFFPFLSKQSQPACSEFSSSVLGLNPTQARKCGTVRSVGKESVQMQHLCSATAARNGVILDAQGCALRVDTTQAISDLAAVNLAHHEQLLPLHKPYLHQRTTTNNYPPQ